MPRSNDSGPAAHVRSFAVALLLALVVLLPGLSRIGLWDPREPVYAQGADEMREHGFSAVATLAGKALPVESLVYWCVAASETVFGRSATAARTPGICFALAAVGVVFYTVSQLRGRRAGLLAVGVLATAPQFYLAARQVAPDIYLLSSYGCGWLLVAAGLFGPESARNRNLVAAGACLGCTVLAGGYRLASVFVLALAAFAFLWPGPSRHADGSPHRGHRLRWIPWVGIVLLVMLAPWLLSLMTDGASGRAWHAGAVAPEATGQPFHYYFQPLFFGLLPWTCFLPFTVVLARRRKGEPLERRGFEVLLLTAAAMTVAAIGTSAGKWPSYVAPILIPLAVLVGLVLDRLTEELDAPVSRMAWAVAAMLFIPAVLDLTRHDGVKYLIELVMPVHGIPNLWLPLGPLPPILFAIALVLLSAIVVRFRIHAGALVAGALALAIYCQGILLPALDPTMSMEGTCRTWKDYRVASERIGYIGDDVGHAYYYCGPEVVNVDESEFLAFMDPDTPASCVVERDELESLSKLFAKRYSGGRLHTTHDAHRIYVLVANHRPPSGR